MLDILVSSVVLSKCELKCEWFYLYMYSTLTLLHNVIKLHQS